MIQRVSWMTTRGLRFGVARDEACEDAQDDWNPKVETN